MERSHTGNRGDWTDGNEDGCHWDGGAKVLSGKGGGMTNERGAWEPSAEPQVNKTLSHLRQRILPSMILFSCSAFLRTAIAGIARRLRRNFRKSRSAILPCTVDAIVTFGRR